MLRPTSVLLAPAKKGAKAAAPRGRPAKNKRTVSPSKTAKPKRARPSKKVEPKRARPSKKVEPKKATRKLRIPKGLQAAFDRVDPEAPAEHELFIQPAPETAAAVPAPEVNTIPAGAQIPLNPTPAPILSEENIPK
jgi:hypothetical protein